MNTKEALDILTQVCAQVNANLEAHKKIQFALEYVKTKCDEHDTAQQVDKEADVSEQS